MTPQQFIKKYWWAVLIPVGLALGRRYLSGLFLEAGKAGLDIVTSPIAAAGQWMGELFYPPNEVAPYAGTIKPEDYYALSDADQRAMRERILKGEIKVNWR